MSNNGVFWPRIDEDLEKYECPGVVEPAFCFASLRKRGRNETGPIAPERPQAGWARDRSQACPGLAQPWCTGQLRILEGPGRQ